MLECAGVTGPEGPVGGAPRVLEALYAGRSQLPAVILDLFGFSPAVWCVPARRALTPYLNAFP